MSKMTTQTDGTLITPTAEATTPPVPAVLPAPTDPPAADPAKPTWTPPAADPPVVAPPVVEPPVVAPPVVEPPVVEPPVVEPPVVDEVSLTLPEDSKVSQARADEIVSYAKEHGLSQDVANEMLTKEDAGVKKYEQDTLSELSEARGKWIENLKSDPEFGGENFEKTVQRAQRTIKEFASKEFADFLNRTGYGDNDELIKFCAKIGGAFKEDTLMGRGVTSPDNQPRAIHDRLYQSKE